MSCPICYNPLNENEKVVTKCNHEFCLPCFINQISINKSYSEMCAICRTPLTSKYKNTVKVTNNGWSNMLLNRLESDSMTRNEAILVLQRTTRDGLSF